MSAQPRWDTLKTQLSALLRMKGVDKGAALSIAVLANTVCDYINASSGGPSDAQLLEASSLLARVVHHSLGLVVTVKDAATLEDRVYAGGQLMGALMACWQRPPRDRPAVATMLKALTTTGLLAAIMGFCKVLTSLLEQGKCVSAQTYDSAVRAFKLTHTAVVLWPDAKIYDQPLLAAAAAPMLAAAWAMLQHQYAPVRLTPAARASPLGALAATTSLQACNGAKQAALGLVRAVTLRVHRSIPQGVEQGSTARQLQRKTVLGAAPEMPQLLMAHFASDVGCCWHMLEGAGHKSRLGVPRRVPLKGYGDVRQVTRSSGSSSGQRQREQQLQSIYIELQHEQLLQHLGVVLPPLESLTDPSSRPHEGEEASLFDAALTLQLVIAHGVIQHDTSNSSSSTPRSNSSSSSRSGGGAGGAGGSSNNSSLSEQLKLSTTTYCKLLRVLLQALLLLDSQHCFGSGLIPLYAVLGAFNALHLLRSNGPFQPPKQGAPSCVPEPNSEVSSSALHALRLLLHHIVPALLYGCRDRAEIPLAHRKALGYERVKSDLAQAVRWCLDLAIAGHTTVGSWQHLATTDRSAIISMIEQKPLHSLMSLELALRHSGSFGYNEQLSLALALFGVPDVVGDAANERDFSKLGLLSPALMAAAGRDDPPGLRQRVLSLMATGLKLALVYAEAASSPEDTSEGVMAAGIVTSICHCFNTFSSSCNAVIADPSTPPAAAVELRKELLAAHGRVLHAAGRVQHVYYTRAAKLPTSGRMPIILFAINSYNCRDGHWQAVIKLLDLWEGQGQVLSSSSTLLLNAMQQLLPADVVRPLLEQESTLSERSAAAGEGYALFSRVAWSQPNVTHPLSWRQQVPTWLEQATEVSKGLQAYGAALAALCPRTYLCNNLECLVLDHETESAAATKLCSKCRQARYCCAACQKANWRDLHKPTCSRLVQAEATPAAPPPAPAAAGTSANA